MEERRSFVAIFAAIGILTIIGGAYVTYSQVSFLNRCEKARGTVVDILWKTQTDDDGSAEYAYPVFEFRDPKGSGTVILAQGHVGSNPSEYQVGDIADILYDPQEPQYVYINTFWDIWMGPVIAFSLGSAFILVAALVTRVPMERFS